MATAAPSSIETSGLPVAAALDNDVPSWVKPRYVYLAASAFWLLTRALVLVHQGGWPWMNAFVVESARGIIAGDWNEAFRPPFPALLAVPLVATGLNEEATIAVLYIIASLIQFAGFALVMRLAFPSLREQGIGLLLFLVIPMNHSIHHYRDIPVVLASSSIFFLAAHWAWAMLKKGQRVWRARSIVWVLAAEVVGVWSRTEMLAFVVGLILLALIIWRRAALSLVILYAFAALVGIGSLTVVERVAGVNFGLAAQYQVHTFLDSTPESWLTPACRAAPTENCRDQDGSAYFAPINRDAGVLPIVLNHPLLVLEKTIRSAADNLWLLFGTNVSTFPLVVPFVILAFILFPACRQALRTVPLPLWVAAASAFIVSVWPLSWAPPHPQYHLQMLLPVVLVLTPVLTALSRLSRASLSLGGFFLVNAALSVFRYTRYSGY